MSNSLAYDFSFNFLADGVSTDLTINVLETIFLEGSPKAMPSAVTGAYVSDGDTNPVATAVVDTLGNVFFTFASAPDAGLRRLYSRFIF